MLTTNLPKRIAFLVQQGFDGILTVLGFVGHDIPPIGQLQKTNIYPQYFPYPLNPHRNIQAIALKYHA